MTGSPGAVVLLASSVAEGHGGIQTFNRLLISALQDTDCLGTVIAMVDAVGAAWRREIPCSFCAGGSRFKFAAGAVAHALGRRGALIMATHVGLAPVGRVLKRLTGGRLLVILHGAEAWGPFPSRTSWGLRECDRLVAVSHFTLRRFREGHPELAHLAGDVCHLPARRLEQTAPIAPPRGSFSGPRVLVTGRLWGRGLLKGQRQLLAIWGDIVSEFPSAELWVVGEGEGHAELERLARTLGVAEHVRFTGGVSDPDLARIYAGSDVFAMPSRGEGFGLVFAEAMAYGLPCVASSEDAGAEVVVHGETGLVVDPNNLQAIKSALRSLLADAALRARLGEAGRRRASELFSVEGFNRRIQNLLIAPATWPRPSTS